jgi:hypothetical protein
MAAAGLGDERHATVANPVHRAIHVDSPAAGLSRE